MAAGVFDSTVHLYLRVVNLFPMFTLYFSSHYAAPLILDNSYKSMVIKTQAFHQGFKLYEVFSSEDRSGCIEAWERLNQVIKPQIRNHQLN